MSGNNRSDYVSCYFLHGLHQQLNKLIPFLRGRHVYGIGCAVAASAFFAVANLFTYAAGMLSNPSMVIVFDANICMICCAVLAAIKRPQHLTHLFHTPGILFCGFLQTLGQFTFMFAIIYIGAGNATALAGTTPIFALVLGYIFINTKLHWSHSLFTISSICGLVLVSRAYLESSTNENFHDKIMAWLGILAALTGASANAGALVVRRKLSDYAADLNSILVVLAFTLQYSTASLIVCFASDSWSLPQHITDLLILSGSGPNNFFGIYLCFLATYQEHPAVVSVILTLTVLLVFFGQIAIFNMKLHWMSLLGSILIIVACVGVAGLSLSEDPCEEDREDTVCFSSQTEELETLLEEELSEETQEE